MITKNVGKRKCVKVVLILSRNSSIILWLLCRDLLLGSFSDHTCREINLQNRGEFGLLENYILTTIQVLFSSTKEASCLWCSGFGLYFRMNIYCFYRESILKFDQKD